MNYFNKLLLGAAGIFAISCNSETKDSKSGVQLPEGKWRAVISLNQEELPFIFDLKNKDNTVYTFEIINGSEKIFVDEIETKGDSFFVKLPVFNSEIKAKVQGEEITGVWVNNARENNNTMPFKASHAIETRFTPKEKPNHNVTGKWEIGFYDPKEKSGEFKVEKALGEFQQTGEIVTGTILTPTGDYRYLEGVVDGNTLYLSAFDGAHAFLFKANINENRMEGDFFSGVHHNAKWMGQRNDDFHLPNPDSLTFLKTGFDKIEFSFPDLNGKKVSIDDAKFKNKAVIIQVMGSWCPNCMDETAYLSETFNKYNSKGLEVIALAYETSSEFEKAKNSLNRLIKRYNVKYDVLVAGTYDKKLASETLPFLNHVMAFPTTIFIDKAGKVRKIHTGFRGPGTGNHYEEFTTETNAFIEKLIAE